MSTTAPEKTAATVDERRQRMAIVAAAAATRDVNVDDDYDEEGLGLLANDDDRRDDDGNVVPPASRYRRRRRRRDEGCEDGDEDDRDDSSDASSSSSDRRREEEEEEEEDYDDDDIVPSASYSSSFLLVRMRANPRLSIVTLMSVVATFACAMLTTDEPRGGSFLATFLSSFPISRRGDYYRDCGVVVVGRGEGRDDRRRASFPSFPAKALLGIVGRGDKRGGRPGSTSTSSSSSSSSTAEGKRGEGRRRPPPPYDPESDFRYESGRGGEMRILKYWEEVADAIERDRRDEYDKDDVGEITTTSSPDDDGAWTNIASWGPCYPRALPPDDERGRRQQQHRGPLRDGEGGRGTSESVAPPHGSGNDDDYWSRIVQSNSGRFEDDDGGGIVYPTVHKPPPSSRCVGGGASSSSYGGEDLVGLCRPGFLIIGQGKCGTSSLYHYLTGHPRVLPARQKQIDYFRDRQRVTHPLSWYYSNFPSIESFLGRGALMTGEASPGYMPYPSVVEAVVRRLSSSDRRQGGVAAVDDRDDRARSLPKIIAIVRDPVDRARSSYRYNYVLPALKRLRTGKGVTVSGESIPSRMTDEYYGAHHLFSFEELAYAELSVLRECLQSGGRGERWTYDELGSVSDMFFYDSLQRRNRGNGHSRDDPPLVFLDGACYADSKHYLVPRVQWKELAAEHPNKTLTLPNLQLIQSIVGRGVYALPLEWWYEVFSNATAANREEGIHVVCTEDLANDPQKAMADVTSFLGLPYFDFTNVTGVGRYNVDGNAGYDAITKYDDEDIGADVALEEHPSSHQGTLPANKYAFDTLLAISDALMHDLVHFYRPYNERLFHLIGKRCPWD